ncbi:MAG: translocation/assembly module TamB domain-containing protein, partial [Mailhella sp.]|nr:translocation/assembly module TamB domain-containing protein [Mailhella sp.]
SPIVKADITVDKGQVELAKLPGSSIPELEIWTPEKAEAKAQKPASPGRLDVTVRIPNQFFVRGYGLDSEWGGILRIDSPINQPAVGGRLKAVRGSLDILGKTFKLAEGEVRFDGGWPVSPLLNIDMEYVASNLTANILVSGTASRPKLTLMSQPAYAQDEIISQIMFGQSSGSLSHVQAIQLASGVATLTGFGGDGVMDIGRKVLGVDVFRVNSDNDGEQSDVSTTSLEVGTYVRDNIYVGMEQGMGKEADTGAIVQIELLPSLEVQAKAGSKDTEVGIEWKKNY